MREIRDVQPGPRQHVSFSERIVFSTNGRIEPLFDICMKFTLDIFQARIARAMGTDVNRAQHLEQPIDASHVEAYAGRPGERYPLERLQRNLVADDETLPVSRQQAADVDDV